MTMLKGATVVGLVLPNGERLMNENGSPLVFLLEDEQGNIHELYMNVGRMGTYPMFALPPFHVDEQAEALAQTSSQASGRQQLADGVPVAAKRKSTQSKTSNV